MKARCYVDFSMRESDAEERDIERGLVGPVRDFVREWGAESDVAAGSAGRHYCYNGCVRIIAYATLRTFYKIYIKWVGTHAEYNKIDAETVQPGEAA